MDAQESRRHSNALLHSYLQAGQGVETESLLAQLLARAAPFIESRLGRKFRVSIRGGRCPLSPEAEDQCSEVNLLLIEKLRWLKATSSEDSVRDFQSYVETIAENVFRDRLRADHKKLRSTKDALRYLLGARTAHKEFTLWESAAGTLVGGLTEWKEQQRPVVRTTSYQQLLDDASSFARAKLPRADIQRARIPQLVELIFTWIGGPAAFDDLVNIVATLQAEAKGDYPPVLEHAPDEMPTPLATLEAKSDMQMVWADLRRLTVEQRRVLLLQAQHDVIEILLRTGVTTLQEIAAALEMPVSEIEQLRAEGFLSDEQLRRRFRTLKTTIMQQRNRARHKMAEWRERW